MSDKAKVGKEQLRVLRAMIRGATVSIILEDPPWLFVSGWYARNAPCVRTVQILEKQGCIENVAHKEYRQLISIYTVTDLGRKVVEEESDE